MRQPPAAPFPIPDSGDAEKHVYLSVGHQQMMTDAMRPLGLSFWQMTTPRRMAEAGGRLFVDVTAALASPATRASLLEMAGRSDPLMRDALQTVLEREGFIQTIRDAAPESPITSQPAIAQPAQAHSAQQAAAQPVGAQPAEAAPTSSEVQPDPGAIEPDPAIVAELIGRTQASLTALRRDIHGKSGPALLDFILGDIDELRRLLFDAQSHRVFMSAIEASWWLNDQLQAWLGETNAADVLTQSVPDNVTSQMGLALLDVADVIRQHPDVVAFLGRVDGDGFLDELGSVNGGGEAREVILAWLDAYGMRCVGEIDITRPRWSERPRALVPILLGNVRNFEPGEAARRFEQGRQEAWDKEQELLARLRVLPDGERKADETKRRIDLVRTFMGYREYPKYGMVSRYFVYKQALLEEADRLVAGNVIRERDDIFYLSFDELHDVVRSQRADEQLMRERTAAFRSYEALTPPRVLTSDGEAVAGTYRRGDQPTGALVGLAVSAGTVEGRARVLVNMGDGELERGDILVTPFTDPSWTPAFVSIAGLVTEVGGLMTHGAVIAREYGLPAVVGVEHATRRIRDGQRIRVDGTNGYVEILG